MAQQSAFSSPAPTSNSRFSNLSNDQSQIRIEEETIDGQTKASQKKQQDAEEGETNDQDDVSSLEDFLADSKSGL